MSLAHLKKQNGLANLQNKIKEMRDKGGKRVDPYWKLSKDPNGTGLGSATIRFLPQIESEEIPYVQIKESFFGVKNTETGKKDYYINRSLKSIGKPDPVDDEYWAMINTGDKEIKEQAKLIRQRDLTIVWIYVIDDRYAPENNGKVFKTKLSTTVFNMILDKLYPEHPDDEAINVFDPWGGCNFKLRVSNGSNGMADYSKSLWEAPSSLFADDDKFEEMFKQVTGLSSEIDPNNSEFYGKSYTELEDRLRLVLKRDLYKDKDKVDHSKSLADDLGLDDEDDTSHKKEESHKKPDSLKETSNDVDDNDIDDLLNELE